MVSIERVNLLGVQVTARALLNCAEHERSSVLGLGAVTDPALLDMLLALPTRYPCRDPAPVGGNVSRGYRPRGPRR